jgi:hypothetical protein
MRNRTMAGIDMAPSAVIEHEMPGRLRLRIRTRRGDAPFFHDIVQALSKRPEIKEVDANPLTGSILIHHSGSSQAITAAALEQGLFQLGPKQSKEAQSKAPPSDAGPMDAIATGLAGLGLFQVARGQVIGNAAENFWNAYGAQRILGRPEIATAFALLGVFQAASSPSFPSRNSQRATTQPSQRLDATVFPVDNCSARP